MSIRDFFNQTITLYSSTQNKFGDISLDTSINIRARFQESGNFGDIAFAQNAKESIYDALMWVDNNITVDIDYVVSYGGKKYRVIRVETKRGRDGAVHHKKCYLQINKTAS